MGKSKNRIQVALTLVVLIALSSFPINASAATKHKTPNGITCTIVGTALGEKIIGTPKIDVICGLGGNDSIEGLGGNDIIDGGVGNDVINGGEGNDSIYGSAGDDKLRGNSGNDSIIGNAGNDNLDGGEGLDNIQGGDGNDSIAGLAGDDKLLGGTGNDAISAGTGNDSVFGEDGKDVITGSLGNDLLSGGSGDDVISGETGNDKISGGVGADFVFGNTGNDTLNGEDGDDLVSGGEGTDDLTGGVGNDTLQGDGGNDKLTGNEGANLYNGGLGLNTCVTDSTAQDSIDYTCSLFPNLAYLLTRVSGRIASSDPLDFNGCRLEFRGASSSVQAQIYEDGRFTFDAPKGSYQLFVVRQTCLLYQSLEIETEQGNVVIGDKPVELLLTIPKLKLVRIYVKTSKGVALQGAQVQLIPTFPSTVPTCLVSAPNTTLCLNAIAWGYGTLPFVTNELGYVDVYQTPGLQMRAKSFINLGNIQMTSSQDSQLVTDSGATLNLVFG